MKLAILGAGAYGTALASVLKYNGHEVNFYDPYKYPKTTLASALNAAEAIIFCAPSKAFSEIAKDLPKDLPLIIASKGFLSLAPFADFTDFSVLSGAAFADDILNETPPFGDQIALTATSHLCETLFSTELIKIEFTTDARAVLLCGSLKNIYAIYVGYISTKNAKNAENSKNASAKKAETADDKTAKTASETADNKTAKAASEAADDQALFSSIFHELEDLLFENDSDPSVARLSCGLPDLILSSSPDSRNFAFGQLLAENEVAKAKNGSSAENNSSNIKSFLSKNTVEGYNALTSPDFKQLKVPSTAKLLNKTINLVKELPCH